MNDKKIIISYEEYLELLKYKEMVEEAKNSPSISFNYPPSIDNYVQYVSCDKLFNYLKERNSVEIIELKNR